jgi:hypothetical protein
LFVQNNTNDIIDVKALDIKIVDYDLILEPNIIIVRLRPGKYLKINEFTLERGYGKYNAGKFSLLDNVVAYPLDIEPFDVVKKTGTRSISKDVTQYYISFKTTCNIKPRTVMHMLCDELTSRLSRMFEQVSRFTTENKKGDVSYTSEDTKFTVNAKDNMYTYKFIGEQLTLAGMVGQRCYLLDKNIAYCGPTVERYDTEVCVIRLKHADASKLLTTAIEECIADLKILRKAF